MKKLIKALGTEFEQNGCDLVIIDTKFRAGKPIMLNSKDLDIAILNAEPEALDSITIDDKQEEPESGVIIKAFNKSGYPTEVEVKNQTELPASLFRKDQSPFLGAIESIKIPKEVTNIPDYFAYKQPLKNFTFHEGLERIGESAFSYSNLEKVILPSTLTYIGYSCFAYNKKLKEVTIPEGLDLGGMYLFQYSEELEKVNLPANFNGSFGAACFKNTKVNMKTVPDGTQKIQGDAFYGTPITQMSVLNAWVSSSKSSFNGAFYSCPNLVALWLGNVTSLDKNLYQHSNTFKKLFINQPRATVETFTGWANGFQPAGNSASLAQPKVICNDDPEWITKEEFDAIDWATYTE